MTLAAGRRAELRPVVVLPVVQRPRWRLARFQSWSSRARRLYRLRLTSQSQPPEEEQRSLYSDITTAIKLRTGPYRNEV